MAWVEGLGRGLHLLLPLPGPPVSTPVLGFPSPTGAPTMSSMWGKLCGEGGTL